MLNVALSHPGPYGWGTCSSELKSALQRITEVNDLSGHVGELEVDGPLLVSIGSAELKSTHPGIRSKSLNLGYSFIENNLQVKRFTENAKAFDVVLSGSLWGEQALVNAGITNTGVLFQGVNTETFKPMARTRWKDRFVIFSGGKFEYRKGQDIVIKAFNLFREKHDDAMLVASWFNPWDATKQTMRASRHIDYSGGNPGELIPDSGVVRMDPLTQDELATLMNQTDIGLFPNRCEAGTNLVLMEYIACGKPVVGACSTGQEDILPTSSLNLKYFTVVSYKSSDGEWLAEWPEPDIEEVMNKLESAYSLRGSLPASGLSEMRRIRTEFTWADTADEVAMLAGVGVAA